MMLHVDHISLIFEDNGRLHGDLVLEIGGEHWRCDSYFLWCENPKPDADHAAIVTSVLAKLIDQWVTALCGLVPGSSCFLPYDFSDQFTRWLRCTLEGSDLVVQRGWSEIEGWSFAPSDIGELLANVPDFRSEGPTVSIHRESMLRSLAGTSDAA
jgi:hypothetical protein